MSDVKSETFINCFEKDKKDGVRAIYSRQYLILDHSTNMYKCAKRWIKLSPGNIHDRSSLRKECLLKAYTYDLEGSDYTATEKEILKANNYILPEIARAFGIESASYGRFKIIDDYDGEMGRNKNIAYFREDNIPVYRIRRDQEYILTPSFLEHDEELVPFAYMGNEREKDVSAIWKYVERTLTSRSISKEKIKEIRRQYALKSIFGAFVELNDNHNFNDGIIFTNDAENRSARLAPAFDLDNAVRVYNLGVLGPHTFIKTASDGGMEVSSMLKEFEHDLTEKDFARLMKNLTPENIIRIIESANRRHSLHLTADVELKYINFFSEKYREIEEFYRERFEKDIGD